MFFNPHFNNMDNTIIPFEQLQQYVTCTVCALLIPIFLIPQKNFKRIILKGLKRKFFLLKRLKEEEFYEDESAETVEDEPSSIFFFKLNYNVELEEIIEDVCKIFEGRKYRFYHSFLSNNNYCRLEFQKGFENVAVEIHSGTHVPRSFRVQVKTIL